jgi:uncharacterized protein YndB with AHSA1/START domain
MAEAAAVRRVGVPLDKVWAAVADHHRIARFGPGMAVELERHGDPDAGGVGAIRLITGPGGVRIREEITEYRPGRALGYRALSGIPLPGWTGEVALRQLHGDTVVRWQLRTTATFPGAPLLLHTTATLMLTALLRTLP